MKAGVHGSHLTEKKVIENMPEVVELFKKVTLELRSPSKSCILPRGHSKIPTMLVMIIIKVPIFEHL